MTCYNLTKCELLEMCEISKLSDRDELRIYLGSGPVPESIISP